MVDALQTVDLGIFAHAMENIMWEVISLKLYGTTQEENCARLHTKLKQHYSDNRIVDRWRGKMKLEKIKTSSGCPKLKTQEAVVRHMGGFAWD